MIFQQLIQFGGPRQVLALGVLLLLVLVSGMAVALVKYESRKLFTEMEKLRMRADEMVVDWGRLQIELATWTEHGRIEGKAQKQLDMYMPAAAEILILSANEKQ